METQGNRREIAGILRDSQGSLREIAGIYLKCPILAKIGGRFWFRDLSGISQGSRREIAGKKKMRVTDTLKIPAISLRYPCADTTIINYLYNNVM